MIDLRATSKEFGERILKRLQRNGAEELARFEAVLQEEYIAGVAADMGGPQVRRGPVADPTGLAPPIDPLHHLRLFSNYLTPRKGLLSADTWRAIAVVSRNLGLTWMVLLPLLLAATL